MTGFNFFKFVFDTLSLTVMDIDIDLFYLPCSNYPIYSMKTLFSFFPPILEHSFERQLFLIFSLFKISAAYVDFLFLFPMFLNNLNL